MSVLVAKLTLTPLLIALATLAARRWGPAIGGWFAGLPLTSGPVSVFLQLEQGRRFAAVSAKATLLGLVAAVAFCVAYASAAKRLRWPVACGAGLLSYFVISLVLSIISLGIYASILLAYAAIFVALFLMPARPDTQTRTHDVPWDLPLRMLSATGIVLLITAMADRIGPVWSGLLSPFPVFSSVMAVFSQRTRGPRAAIHLLRGIVIGSFAFAGFFAVVSLRITFWSVFSTYCAALVVTVLINGVSLVHLMSIQQNPHL